MITLQNKSAPALRILMGKKQPPSNHQVRLYYYIMSAPSSKMLLEFVGWALLDAC